MNELIILIGAVIFTALALTIAVQHLKIKILEQQIDDLYIDEPGQKTWFEGFLERQTRRGK